jgi:predicted extracellular nuclease
MVRQMTQVSCSQRSSRQRWCDWADVTTRCSVKLLADIRTRANCVAVVSANLTLSTLAAAIRAAGGPQYAFTDVAPVDDKDGGQPGGNIRTAYMYKPELIRLYKANPGGPLDANQVLDGPTLKYNPGRIDPANEAWTASRKPLVAQWEVISKKGSNKKEDVFFTVNVHFGSKGGSSSLHGDARPPVNGGVQDRIEQSIITANFVKVCTLPEWDADKRRLLCAVGGHCNVTAVVQDPLPGHKRRRLCWWLKRQID